MAGSPINQERRNRVMFYRDEDGRTFTWIAKKEGISAKVARSLYHSEKNLRLLAEKREKEDK